MKQPNLYFNVKTFCPENIAEKAVNFFAACHKCTYTKLLHQLGLNNETFKDAIEEQIKNVARIKDTTQRLEISGVHFRLKIRKDGVAKLIKE